MIPLNEFVETIIGEGPHMGETCALIRVAGCNLNCEWCDTPDKDNVREYVPYQELVGRIMATRRPRVLITGGEPLQCADTEQLLKTLINGGMSVILETNGSLPLEKIPKEVIKSVDIKTPSSGYAGSFFDQNTRYLGRSDSAKFVLADRDDFKWAKAEIDRLGLLSVTEVLLSPVWSRLEPSELARWILDSHLPIRLSVQLHKIIGVP